MCHQVLGDGVVEVGVGGIGDEVDLIDQGEQLAVVAEGLAAEMLSGSGGTGGIGFHHILDMDDVIFGGAQEGTVDVSAGAAVANDGDV